MAESILLHGPNFTQVTASLAQVQPTGAATTYKLGDILAGSTPVNKTVVGLTAHAGGGQASALLLSATVNEVSTVATIADSVALPLAAVGLKVVVVNASATSMQVFGSGTDTINGVATGTGVAQAGGVSAVYYCTKSAPAGTWRRVQSS